MQTIWSRIAQTGSCRCPQCVSQAGGIARRAAASATRQVPKYQTSSTLWLSGIFASAATLDASVKIQRRAKWDQAIAEVRHDLKEHEENVDAYWAMAEEEVTEIVQEHELVADGVRAGEQQPTEYLQTLQTSPQDLELQDLQDSDVVDGEDKLFDLIYPMPERPRWPANTGRKLNSRNVPPQSIYATPEFKEEAYAVNWSAKKIEISNQCTDLMQWRMFKRLRQHGLSEEAAASVPGAYGDLILKDLETINAAISSKQAELARIQACPAESFDSSIANRDDFSICDYGHQLDGSHQRTLNTLHRKLRNLFSSRQRNDFSHAALLARTCYHLGTCSAPPSVETHNILLIGMSGTKDNRTMELLIKTLGLARIRSNEVTLVKSLQHHIDTNDKKCFAALVGRMRGQLEGIMLANPDIVVSEISEGRLIEKTLPNGKTVIVQKPNPTPMVFETVVSGVLKFFGFEQALEICREMGTEGWGLCTGGFTSLLNDCIERKDWNSGRSLWRKVLDLERESVSETPSHLQPERIGLRTFAAMLRLCAISDAREAYDNVWEHALRSGHAQRQLTNAVKEQAGLKPPPKGDRRKRAERREARAAQTEEADPPLALLQDGPEELSCASSSTPSDHRLQSLAASRVLQELALHQQKGSRHDSVIYQEALIPPLTQEQLHGLVTGSEELNEYEERERPMTMMG